MQQALDEYVTCGAPRSVTTTHEIPGPGCGHRRRSGRLFGALPSGPIGCTDAVLLEREELTSGSTWHAAGGMHTINGDPNVAKLQKYTIELYKEIEALSGQPTGLHLTGGVLLAATEPRFEWLKSMPPRADISASRAQIITPEQAHELMPLLDPSCFVGATADRGRRTSGPVRHHAGLCQAARKLGAQIERFTKVEQLVQSADRSWRVITNKGEIRAEHVVNAGGLWAREVGHMVGREHPVLAMEHMYLITEDMPEVAAINRAPARRCCTRSTSTASCTCARSAAACCIGTYEKACKPWSRGRDALGFGHELLTPDLERIAPSLEVGLPAFSGIPAGGHQEDRQRSLHLCAGRQPAGRARCADCRATGAPAASWQDSARAAASGSRSPTG